MESDIKNSEVEHPNEPETRSKKTIHRTFTTKFRDVLKVSQNIQTEFKNAVQARIKKQIRMAKKDATDEEVDNLSRDPEAVQKLMQEQVCGSSAHSKVQNTVNDIQAKYEAILKLEQSVNDIFDLFQELANLI